MFATCSFQGNMQISQLACQAELPIFNLKMTKLSSWALVNAPQV